MSSPYSCPLRLSALSLALLLAGCQFQPLKPTQAPAPAAPAGPCIAACETIKTQCGERQRAREQLCQEQRARLADPKLTCDPKSDPLCPQPIDCLGEDLTPCRIQYDECASRCASAPAASAKQAG